MSKSKEPDISKNPVADRKPVIGKKPAVSKKTVIAVVSILVLLAGFLTAWLLLKPSAVSGGKELTIHVHHLNGETRDLTVKTDAEFLRGALEPEGIVSGTEESYGLWIRTVDGETADETLQQWWGYEINGETAMYGADSQPVADGDVIDFTLNVGY